MLEELLCEAKLAELDRALEAELTRRVADGHDATRPNPRVGGRRVATAWWRFGARTAATEASDR